MKYYQLDNDTKKYIKRLNYNGYKTPADIYSVDQFIRGLKDLGVYGNMIEAWFFRKNHNAGSGNIVYAFKDSFNSGTINNSSTASWNDRGLICTATSSSSTSNYITCNLRPNSLSTVSLFSIFMSTPANMEGFTSGFPYASSLSTSIYGGTNSSSFSILSIGSNGQSWSSSLNNVNNPSIINGNSLFKIVKGSVSSTSVISESRNISKTLTSSSTSNTQGILRYDRFIFNGRWNNGTVEASNGSFGVGFHGTHIFTCFFDINVNFVSFETLFKNTIGNGIDLP
jgi:hypothetical protein